MGIGVGGKVAGARAGARVGRRGVGGGFGVGPFSATGGTGSGGCTGVVVLVVLAALVVGFLLLVAPPILAIALIVGAVKRSRQRGWAALSLGGRAGLVAQWGLAAMLFGWSFFVYSSVWNAIVNKADVPYVVSSTVAEAKQTLADKGFAPPVIEKSYGDGALGDGCRVTTQTPTSADHVFKKTVVHLLAQCP